MEHFLQFVVSVWLNSQPKFQVSSFFPVNKIIYSASDIIYSTHSDCHYLQPTLEEWTPILEVQTVVYVWTALL